MASNQSLSRWSRILLWLNWLAVCGYTGVIYYYSTISLNIPVYVKSQDKYLHLVAYAVMGILWLRVLTIKRWQAILISIAIAGTIGFLVEIRQIYCNRMFEWADVLSNFLGTVLGVLAYSLLQKCCCKNGLPR